MKTTTLSSAALALLTALATLPASAAGKVTLNCDFPAAQASQKVKPGQKGVSDGSIRIDAVKMRLPICNGCVWEKSGAKWKVTADEYRLAVPSGIAIVISRKTGEAVFSLTSKEDEIYYSGHVESRGQCQPQ